ncbi:MAG: hypothetical protein KGR22_02940 [Planctomycetes bacterium]|nr:hypothetical protein [Planctomycetota bacterium]
MQQDAWILPGLLAQAGDRPLRWVALHHACPERGEHVDWMFEPTQADAPLPSARIPVEPASIALGGRLHLEPAPNHRREYLDAPAGPRSLSGDRGTVRRIASGSWRSDGRRITLRQDAGEDRIWLVVASPVPLTLERIA